MEDHRKKSQLFEYVLISVLLVIFLCILGAMVEQTEPPEVITVVSGWGGIVLGMIAVAVNFAFGSSKGSQLKDEAQNRKPTESPPITTGPDGVGSGPSSTPTGAKP